MLKKIVKEAEKSSVDSDVEKITKSSEKNKNL